MLDDMGPSSEPVWDAALPAPSASLATKVQQSGAFFDFKMNSVKGLRFWQFRLVAGV